SDGSDIPVFAWQLAPGHSENWNLHHLSTQLRERGWQVPAYPLPDDLADQWVQRIVVRNGLSHDLADLLMRDLRSSVEYLDSLDTPMPTPHATRGFHH
ncbi:glutamate decarboxylase, partial [Streptomyces sp. SID10244]|nr:glutamate decarboxylase [Streptomyces sp. SID10244]